MAEPSFNAAYDAVKKTIVNNYAAKIAILNAARYITITSSKEESYTLGAGTLFIESDGKVYPWTPGAGTYTAAQLVTSCDAADAIFGCNDDDGTFEIRLSAAATADHTLRIKKASNDIDDELGFVVGDHVHRVPINALTAYSFFDAEPEIVDRRPYVIAQDLAFSDPENLRGKQPFWTDISLMIGDAHDGGEFKATRDLLFGHVRAIREVITENRRLGGAALTTRIERMRAMPRLFSIDGRGPVYGEIELSLSIRMFNG